MVIAVAVQCSVRFALQVCSKSAFCLIVSQKSQSRGSLGWRVVGKVAAAETTHCLCDIGFLVGLGKSDRATT